MAARTGGLWRRWVAAGVAVGGFGVVAMAGEKERRRAFAVVEAGPESTPSPVLGTQACSRKSHTATAFSINSVSLTSCRPTMDQVRARRGWLEPVR